MSGDTKIIIGVVLVTVVLLTGAIWVFSGQSVSSQGLETESRAVEIKVRNDGYNMKGNPDAGVEIVEFSDFECPACGDTYSVLNQVAVEYGDRVRFVYQHFPLSQHPMARPSAEAAEAAGLQGKFWEMHDGLFENQEELSEDKIRELAERIGLKMEKFNADWKSSEVRDRVLVDLAEGNRIGVNATPSIYINGILFEGLRSVEGIGAVLESELAKVTVVEDDVIEATGSVELDGSDM